MCLLLMLILLIALIKRHLEGILNADFYLLTTALLYVINLKEKNYSYLFVKNL